MNYYRRYMGDYQKKTMRLDPTDHGVYDLMLDYCYSEEQPLPLELDDIHSICKATKPEHRKSVTKVLRLYFEERPDGYHNKRADEEIAVSKQARTNGKGHTGKVTGSPTGSVTGQATGNLTGIASGKVTGSPTGEGGGSGHPPTTNHQPPSASLQPSTASQGQQPSDSAKKPAGSDSGKTVQTWAAYSRAYQERYGVEPLRNAKVNGQIGRLIDQVGIDEAPKIAEFYLTHNGGFYVSSGHCVDLLLRDCSKLRTEMVTGRKITRLEARSAEASDALRAQVGRVDRMLEGSKS